MNSTQMKLRCLVVAAATLGAMGAAVAQSPPLPPYLGNFDAAKGWSFEPNLAAALPGDVFVPAKEQLEKKQQFTIVQRLFDLWSWQAFLTVNWPTNGRGQTARSIADYSATFRPGWNAWHESDQIFLPNGGTPPACLPQAAEASALEKPRSLAVATERGLPAPPAAASDKGLRLLFNVSAVGELIHGRKPVAKPHGTTNKISEVDQAFSGPLYDQNGVPAFYEIVMDNNEVGYICSNKLYSLDGQIAFSSKPQNVVKFPSGTWQANGSGATELKLAWKVLDPKKDKADRFFHVPAQVMINGQWTPRDVGLVGMHIAHKSASSPQWIWSTFEQVDNLVTDQVANPDLNPNYFNPGCPTCLVNMQQQLRDGSIPNTPTQVLRMIPIPADKVTLNREAQAALREQNSVWQFYQLIDTQWPTDPSSPPTPAGDGNLPQSITNKPGGQPTPVYLTNATMETYFQAGNQNAAAEEEGNATSNFQVFGTESCMGCHSSAGVAQSGSPSNPTFGGQLSGDFSWLLQMKAH